MSHDDKYTQLERTVLEEILRLDPRHLTIPELVLMIGADRDQSEGEDIVHAIRDLRATGLLRYVGDVVAPTYATLRVAELLERP